METNNQLAPADHQRLGENLMRIQERIRSACERSERAPESVTLVAVTKYGGPRLCQSLAQHGALDLGENRVPHLNQMAAGVDPALAPRWHMIGHLQRNKVKKIEPKLALLHSLDSEELAKELNKRLDRSLDVLIQVNVAGEEQKSGVAPEELGRFLDLLDKYEKISPVGLMTMAMFGDKEKARGTFRDLASLLAAQRSRGREKLSELSMGMSQDFEEAVEEGATLIRVGRVLYERLEDIDNDQSSIMN
ncbi:MAG: YggS family pyridoxal phosphate-dependent enzyme [Planctomycetota bacterium]|nr:YggS family pyridoxal phosphate-dependent enzyme [Planctomycetota bacterium]